MTFYIFYIDSYIINLGKRSEQVVTSEFIVSNLAFAILWITLTIEATYIFTHPKPCYGGRIG